MGVTFTRSDLDFILTQIGYAESGQQPVNPHLAFGLRQVDGQNNSIVDGQPLYGAAAQTFPRLTNPVFQNADPSLFGSGPTSYANTGGFVFDAGPRIISNLIADQTAENPAAVVAAAAANAQLGDGYQHTLPGADGVLGTADDIVSNTSTPAPVASDGSLFINNVTPDNGLSAPFNSVFTLFGQFFDHGLDLTAKGGSGTVMIPLKPDDPLYDPKSQTNFMVLSRATNQPGPDGVLGTADDIHANTNLVTPFVDQNQTYTSHPSHQVFLREYINGTDGKIHSTGRLLEGVRADGSHGEPTWADIKANAIRLGIQLNDTLDVVNVPLVKVDAYGNFIADPVTGLAQLVVGLGADGKYGTDDDVVIHGTRDANGTIHPITTELALRIGTAFINDLAATANPFNPATGKPLAPDTDGIVNDAAHPGVAGTFDVDLLNRHFVAGDGRANENIGLTAIHKIFHDEHNRLVEQTKDVVRAELAKGDTAFATAWTIAGANLADGIQENEWNGERLFQAAKFGTETQYQHLVFEEFARKVSPAIHVFGNTNVHLDPSITQEFANAVYRFGHSMLDENINRYVLQDAWLDASGKPTAVNTGTSNPLAGTPVMDANGHPVLNAIGLIAAFTNPLEYASHGANAAGEIALGSVNQVGNEIDEFVTGTLRNNLLGLPLDLAALNIARGRDVGIAPLNLLRNQIYTASQDTSVKPYANWSEFGQFLKHEASLINFVAAYGTHASILAATTTAEKRAAAFDLVTLGNNDLNRGKAGASGDAYDFLHGLGAYAHITDPAALKAIVFGGDGNDVIDGGKGIDDIQGGLGNDIIRAGEGDDEALGNEGNDWMEGGQGGDVLSGDVGAPTGQLPLYGGDDVLIGGSYVATGADGHPVFDAANALSNNGGDKMLAFSGDDVMIGGGGFNTFRGGKGFDWASFEFDGQGVSVDMNKKDFVLDAPPLSPDAIRDIFIETEGLSGSSYDDELIGSNDAKADTTNELTNINLIQGLDTFFPPDAPVHYNSGNIILGGGGSDRISGGGGNDIIDGDAYLHVSLQNGQIVREILNGGRPGDVDTAVYSDIAANYSVGTATADGRGWNGLDAEGFFSVVHLTVGAGGGVTKVTNDGADKLRNIERLEFSDGLHTVNEFILSIPVRNQLPGGTVTISGTPVIGNILTAIANLTDPDAKLGSQTVTNPAYQWEYQDPARAKWVPITGATSSTLKVADFEVGLPIRVVASYVDAKGYTESFTSAQTALVTTAPGVNTAPFVVPQQGQVGLPDTIVLDNVPVNLFLPVTTVFGDAQTPANALAYKVALANGASLSTIGLTVDMSGIATNGAIRITGTLTPGSTGPFDIQVSATDAGPGTPLTITDTFTLTVMHASPGSLAVINGSLQDGFIAGATVFMDSNGDGLRQSFEAQTTTDATGHFSLAGKPGSLVAFGGPGAVDIATLLPFDGIYKAPVGSTVLTPLTTILSEGLEQGASLTDVQTALRSALQLAPGVDITKIDPIAAIFNPDPVQKALGIHLFVTASQILNTVALLQAASPNAAPLADITTLLLSGKEVDLTDPTTVNNLVAATGLFGGFADDAAKIVLASNSLLAAKAAPGFSPLDILTGVSAASIVAKGMTADALSHAFTLAEMDSVASHFSGTLLAAEVTNATHKVGDVNGDGTGDASQAPPTRLVALVNPTSSVAENTNVQNGLKVADIVIVDLDASTDVVSVAGRDASSFAVRDGILGKELWYVGGNLDYESGKTAYDVTVSVSNPASTGTAPFTASMTMTVLNVNEAPVAVTDSYTTAEDNVLSVSAANGVLKNDTDPDNIPGVHQDPMSAVLVSGPAHGTLVLNADGSFVYTSDANFNAGYDPATKQVNPGPDSFTYVASDGQLSSAPVTVTLGVTPVDDAPSGSPGLTAALAGANSVTLTASPGTLSDVDGIPATGPGAVAYTWERSATGLGPWSRNCARPSRQPAPVIWPIRSGLRMWWRRSER